MNRTFGTSFVGARIALVAASPMRRCATALGLWLAASTIACVGPGTPIATGENGAGSAEGQAATSDDEGDNSDSQTSDKDDAQTANDDGAAADGEDGPAGNDASGSEASTDDATEGEGDNCGETTIELASPPPNVMLVLDKSGSMSRNTWIDQDQQVTRWYSLHRITGGLLDKFDSSVNFGLKYFPHLDATNDDSPEGCIVDPGVHVEVGPNNRQAILDAIPLADELFEGHTPTLSALTDTVDYMKTVDDENADAIILIVDGETNCSTTNAQVADVAADAYKNGISVYVVGIDLGPSVADELGQVAVAGGTQQVFNASDGEALDEALESLITGIGSCTIGYGPQVPATPDLLTVIIDENEVPRIDGAHSCAQAAELGMEHGWVVTDEDAPFDEIELCGRHCQDFRDVQRAELIMECPLRADG